METARAHAHSLSFRQKRLAALLCAVLALVAITVTTFTGSWVTGTVGAIAVVAALAFGFSTACHRGCTPG